MSEHALTPAQARAVELYSILSEAGFDRSWMASVIGAKLLQEGASLRGHARQAQGEKAGQFYEEVLEIEELMINDLGVHPSWEDIRKALSDRDGAQVEWVRLNSVFVPGDPDWFGNRQQREFEAGQQMLLSCLERRQIVANMHSDETLQARPRKRL